MDAVCTNFYSHIKLYLEEMPTFSLKEISVNNATYVLLNSKGTFRFRKRSHVVPFAPLVLLKGKGKEKVNIGFLFFFFPFGRLKNMIKI